MQTSPCRFLMHLPCKLWRSPHALIVGPHKCLASLFILQEVALT